VVTAVQVSVYTFTVVYEADVFVSCSLVQIVLQTEALHLYIINVKKLLV